MVQLLIKSGAQVNDQNNFGETSLHLASKNNTSPIDRNIIKILIDHGADIFLHNNIGKKASEHKDIPLHDAIVFGDSKAITKILMSKVNANLQDVYGRTALYYAIGKRNIESSVIRNLLLVGSDVNVVDTHQNSPLHEAIIIGNISIVRLLLNAGAQVNKQNNQGDTALHLAVKAGYRKAFRHYAAIVKVLIDSGADISLKNNAGKIALEYAVLDNIKKILSSKLQAI
jgi:ankyrin repeat protein